LRKLPCLNARYKEDLKEISRQVGQEAAREYISFSKERIQLLLQKMNP
jgi:hypothetical protein